MAKFLLLFLFSLISFAIQAQSIIGAWESYTTTENGDKLKNVVIIAEGYQVLASYNLTTGKFVHTNGGTWCA